MNGTETPRPQRTKIVCTLGPATASAEKIRDLIVAGADCFRINLSHGDQATHAGTISRVRAVAAELGAEIPILLDLRGAKIRTTSSVPNPFELKNGADLDLAGGDEPSTAERLHVTPALALQNLDAGHRILLDDGKIQLLVTAKERGVWRCRVEVGGPVTDRRGVTLLDVPTRQLPGLTDKDVLDIEFGVRQGVDIFALSFVRSADDVIAARSHIERCGGDIPIISKIEKPEAFEELDAILAASYGVMVARGDLGVEAPLEKVPVYQKRIIAAARRLRKPVITATQMLESMIEKAVPTRAEVSDVANAVFDGTDAVMLSAETSIGKYPVEAVRMMARTLQQAELALSENRGQTPCAPGTGSFADAIGAASCVAADAVGVKCVLVFTASGYSAALVAGHRPTAAIHAFAPEETIVRRLGVFWGVEAHWIHPMPSGTEELILRCEKALLAAKLVSIGDPIAIVAGVPLAVKGNTNILKLHRIGEMGA